MNSVMNSRLLHYFPVIKYRTILPKMVIPMTILIGIARRIARNKVNLKTRNKRGMRTTHTINVKHPVAKSFVSNIWHPFPSV
jgi:hypothetical protein